MGEGHMLDDRCPLDGAALVGDDEGNQWCSLVGCEYLFTTTIERIGEAVDEPRIEVDHLDGLEVTVTVEPPPAARATEAPDAG